VLALPVEVRRLRAGCVAIAVGECQLCRIVSVGGSVYDGGSCRRDSRLPIVGIGVSIAVHRGESFPCPNAPRGSLVPLRRSGRRAACPFRLALVRALLRLLRPCLQEFVGLAGVAELVDALDLGSSIARCGGSSPFARTSSGAGTV